MASILRNFKRLHLYLETRYLEMPRYINVLEVLSDILQCLNQINSCWLQQGLGNCLIFGLDSPAGPLSNVRIWSDTSRSMLQLNLKSSWPHFWHWGQTSWAGVLWLLCPNCVSWSYSSRIGQGKITWSKPLLLCQLCQIILVVIVVIFTANNVTIWWPVGIYFSIFCLLPFGLWYFQTDSAESIWLQWVSMAIIVTFVIVLLVWIPIIVGYTSLIHSVMDSSFCSHIQFVLLAGWERN